jgi:hypothetical protein
MEKPEYGEDEQPVAASTNTERRPSVKEERRSSFMDTINKTFKSSRQEKPTNVIDINAVEDPATQEALKLFDWNKDGKLTYEELRIASDLYRDVKRGYKYTIYALIAVFILAALITGALSLSVFFIFVSTKETNIDTTTGTMMVKDQPGIEVNVKSHGAKFAPDAVMIDEESGMKKNCFNGDKVSEIFKTVSSGTYVTIVDTDGETGDVSVYDVGMGPSGGENNNDVPTPKATWSSTNISFAGGMVLKPNPNCSKNYYEGQDEDEDVILDVIDGTRRRQRRKLQEEYSLCRHLSHRDEVMIEMGLKDRPTSDTDEAMVRLGLKKGSKKGDPCRNGDRKNQRRLYQRGLKSSKAYYSGEGSF